MTDFNRQFRAFENSAPGIGAPAPSGNCKRCMNSRSFLRRECPQLAGCKHPTYAQTESGPPSRSTMHSRSLSRPRSSAAVAGRAPKQLGWPISYALDLRVVEHAAARVDFELLRRCSRRTMTAADAAQVCRSHADKELVFPFGKTISSIGTLKCRDDYCRFLS